MTTLVRSTALRVALTVAILAWLSARLDMAGAMRAVAAVSRPHLLAVLVLVAIDRAVMIYRWWLLLRASGVAVSARTATRIFLVSAFVGSFLPAGVGGDAARTFGLRQHTGDGGEALASVVVDRLLGMLALAAMALAGVLSWSADTASAGVLMALLAAIVLGSALLFWLDQAVRVVLAERAHQSGIGRALMRVGDAMGRYRGRQGVLLSVFVWSVAVQLLRITEAYVLGLGLGLSLPYAYYLLFMPVGLIMLLLPVSISGFGLPQGVFVWMLRPMGVDDATAFALSTLIVLTGLAGNLPGLLLWLRHRRETL